MATRLREYTEFLHWAHDCGWWRFAVTGFEDVRHEVWLTPEGRRVFIQVGVSGGDTNGMVTSLSTENGG
jgi:hypothetical protein